MPTPSMPVASSTEVPPALRLARTVGVVLALVVAAFLALNKPAPDAAADDAGDAGTMAGLAVATGELVDIVVGDDRVTRATGGYVAETGAVLTVEVDELPPDEIDAWASALVRDGGPIAFDLPDGEKVIFLLDIAQPSRVSRLVAIDPARLDAPGAEALQEAPAISTAPLRPTFEPLPED